MSNIIDRLLNLRPVGLPAAPDRVTTAGMGEDDPQTFRAGMTGLGKLPTIIHPTAPYTPAVGGGSFPPVRLSGLMIPPNRRYRHPETLVQSPGLHLGMALAPGQSIRKGIDHPGRRLGHTGNPGKRVGEF